jgi:Stress responsive A/B Barrel Domain
MTPSSRRTFLTSASLLTLGAAANAIPMKNEKSVVVHHVFFWLKNPSSLDDRKKLIEGLKTLAKIESVRNLHIGVPADTEKRPVVDSSYSVSELIFFDDVSGQNIYQDHPIHKKFVADCSALWEKVIVYDSLTAS